MWQQETRVSAQQDDHGQPSVRLTRRQALGRGAGGLLAASSVPALLAASASAAPPASAAASQLTGTLTLLSYPGWYGPNEFANFHKLHPGLSVKNIVSGTTGAAAQIAQISQNKGAFDLTLAGVPVSSQLKLAGLLQPLNTAAVPNGRLVAPLFRQAFPWGVATDFGKTGFGYRADLIKERPTTWHELWQLAAKYSGKVTMIKYDADIQGSALKYLGYSVNTKDQSQLTAMQNALLKLKPHLQAILETDYSKALVQGTAYIAIDYDYDIAAAQQSNKNIVWVQPKEGCAAYLEGWVALKNSPRLAAVWEFMNFHMQPANYASFVNANGCAYVEPAAEKLIKPVYANNPSLKYSASRLRSVEFEQYLGPAQTAYRGKLWEEFLAA
jgi:spermidine/putrescine transport system substrate-binding protein